MFAVFEQTRRAAQADATVLVTGESGTGKELIAEAIHRNSPRQAGPFVCINMAAVPESLVESELFGHAEGAFTGAARARTGRFEAANRGTLFIDEIGDLELTCQAKLLRVLENHYVTPVGSNDNRKVDVRVIAATNRNLENMVSQGEFREDLYYRLNVVSIHLPPLRKRPEDIAPLLQYFLTQFCRDNRRPMPALDEELVEYLQAYEWPGNIRQLRNCIESMVILADSDRLTMNDLPAMVRRHSATPSLRFKIPQDFTLEDVEQIAVQQTLDRYDGNRTRAAQSLGISVRTLQRRLKRWQHGNRGEYSGLRGRSESPRGHAVVAS
jgi:transcriptional regulator with PAS, ATPase and Fis domain